MAKCKSLKNDTLDPIDDIQESLEKQTEMLEELNGKILDILEKYSEKLLISSPVNQKLIEEIYAPVVRKILTEVLDARQKERLANGGDSIEQNITKLLKYVKETYDEFIRGMNLYGLTAKSMDERFKDSVNLLERATLLIESKEIVKPSPKPVLKQNKDWFVWFTAKIHQWVDFHIGIRYIREFVVLISFSIWLLSIGTSFFILRENCRLRDTEEKYLLLRRECRKSEQLYDFVNRLEDCYSEKALEK